MALTKIQSGSFEAGAINTADLGANVTATYATYAAVAANLTPRITTVNVANSSYTVLDDTSVNTSGGYLVITGTNFQSGALVTIGDTPATSTTFVNSTTLRVQVPAKTSGSYSVYVQNPDGGTAIRVLGTSFSNTPVWGTAATLSNQSANTSFGVSLSANSDSNITYSNTTSLPSGTTLLSNGWFYGTITVGAETNYTFSVNAVDVELQDTPRTFSLTVTVASQFADRFTGFSETSTNTGARGLKVVGDYLYTSYLFTTSGSTRIAVSKYNLLSKTIEWTRATSAAPNWYYNTAQQLEVDSSGNVYVGAHAVPGGLTAFQLIKFNSSGVEQFNYKYSGPNTGNNSWPHGMMLNSSETTLYVIVNNWTGAYGYIRINASNGNFIDFYTLGTSNAGDSYTSPYYIHIDSSENIYFGADGNGPAFVGKVNSNNTASSPLWRLASGDGQGTKVKTNSSGQIVAISSRTSGYNFNSGSIRELNLINFGTGTVQWLSWSALNTSGYAAAVDIEFDSSGNIYVLGYDQWQDGSTYGVFLCKFNSTGTLQWTRAFRSSGIFPGGLSISGDYAYFNIGMYDNDKGPMIVKYPLDGSVTGTYTVGGKSLVISSLSLTSVRNNGSAGQYWSEVSYSVSSGSSWTRSSGDYTISNLSLTTNPTNL